MTELGDAEQHLAAQDDDFARLIARVGPSRLAAAPREPYEALVRAVAHQQLHARAAERILGRLLALHPGEAFPAAASMLAVSNDAFRACGFSASKAAAIRSIADHASRGIVPSADEAASLTDDVLIERLVSIRGVGRWTVEMLLIFTLGRPDVLPVDDFGVREGWKLLKRLNAQPRPRELARIGEAWGPWRSTAAWYLWRAADEAKRVRPDGPA
ncbi:MAG: DNA-3-methyladenine glycosylase 2 family protein [Acetobacteraceae bacterium]|nr:DNA-3-methyladenine glycosylase 2 family protein [Acetobacteraceae bacterium]